VFRLRQRHYLHFSPLHRPFVCVCWIKNSHCTRRDWIRPQNLRLRLVSATIGFLHTHDSTTVDKSSRPLWSVIAILAWGPLAYVNVVAAGDVVCKSTLSSPSNTSFLTRLFSQLAPCPFGPLYPLHMDGYLPMPVLTFYL
jgi:hypothetical protein